MSDSARRAFVERARLLEYWVDKIEVTAPYVVAKKAGLAGQIELAAGMFLKGWHDRAEFELDLVEAELANQKKKKRR